MREVEIERLVQWAYRDELPKRGIGDVANSWEAVGEWCELLTVVDDDPGFPVIMGSPHPDALTIESAVQMLHAQVVLDWRTMRDALMGDMPMLAPRGNPMLLGQVEETVSEMVGTKRARPLRPITTERVFSEVALVESFARMGRRPQWNVGTPSPQRVIGRNNRISIVGESKGDGRYTHGSYCPLQYTAPTIEQLVVRRFEYLVWHDGLRRLTGILRGWLMADHIPTEIAAPSTPWLDPIENPKPEAVPIAVSAWPVMEAGRKSDIAARHAELDAEDIEIEQEAARKRAEARQRRRGGIVPSI